MQTKKIAWQLKFDFSEEHCTLDPLLVEMLKKDDQQLVSSANAAFQTLKKTPEQTILGGFQLTLLRDAMENIAYHLWPISKRPNMNNVSRTISEQNWQIYLLARSAAEQIDKLLKELVRVTYGAYLTKIFEEKFFSSLQQRGIIEDTKTVHGWIKHVLRLSEAEQTSVDPHPTTNG